MHFSLREIAFWMQDALLKKNSVKNHCNDIKRKTKENCDSDQQLKSILEYAIENVPYYRNIPSPELSCFPVMTKAVYKQHKDECLSVEFVERTDSLYKAATSGSTGTPLIVYQDSEKKNRVRADLINAHERIGWYLGDHYVFIRNWVSNYKQSALKSFAQNVENVSITDFDDAKKEWLCGHLRKHKNSVIFGYSSSVCDFMHYIKAKGINAQDLKVKLIVCDSDELTSANKRELEKTFCCPVYNRYDNEENGLIAISGTNDDRMYVNYQSLYVELLKPDLDENVRPGEVGRVVITDLYNKAMPLIRYDTGDYAVCNDMTDGSVKVLDEFAGRKADCIYSTDGRLVSSVAVSGLTEIFESIVKYQIIQETETGYCFRYVGSLSEADFDELKSRLYTCLGADANIVYECVENISQQSNGKYKTMINNVEKKELHTVVG